MSGVVGSVSGIVLGLFFLPLAFSFGWVVLRLLLRFSRTAPAVVSSLLLSAEGFLQSFCFGLLLLLIIELLLLSFGLPWNVVTACILFLGGFAMTAAGPALRAAFQKGWRGAAHLNFAIWLFVITVLGATLIGYTRGIATPWVNNYGDVAWHIGMISSFTFGGIFPAEYHIFPGVRLSYPFLINLWTASEWWMAANAWHLGVIFFLQWSICWIAIYAALRGNRNWLLPWAVLFGGGSSILFYRLHPFLKQWKDMGGHAHNLLEKGFPWAPFFTTIWVTQRPALFGAMIVLSTLALFHRFLVPAREGRDVRAVLTMVAAPLSLSILAHTHLFLVTVLYIGFCLLLRVLSAVYSAGLPLISRRAGGKEGRGVLADEITSCILYGVLLLPCLAFVPLIWGKKSTLAFTPGWLPWHWIGKGSMLNALADSFMMWVANAEAWILCALLLTIFCPKRRELLALALVFAVGNVVKTSYWEWDQIKIFLGVYLAFVSLWAYAEDRFTEHSLSLRKIQIACVALMLPGIAEFADAFFYRYQIHTVYSDQDLAVAETIRRLTPPDAIILATPDHNSPVTLSGRRLFEGYNGTLSSHGLDYGKREEMIKNLDRVIHCRDEANPELAAKNAEAVPPALCPDFLLWTDREKRFWPGKDPAKIPALKVTAANELWALP